ncbi:hypothetical protein M409DRAFT_19351 [Zasmidium cellare ATCC 36951]|uniref:DRBM domain-containing protein n=1 Tax=Zasmidium cellare ATCC 36951 TaxID=1080233 RepID=A0A6A6CTV8_ZASCE|nr:uncharacterized protein M409DRAFT_19351 [Zasmidium cellare ATCC 36951]KAF2170531.1 hypothetical protein M409DRAFT_19351 [Zasmidium cellare ATCC 36951]
MPENMSYHLESHMDDQSTSMGGESDREPTVVNAVDEEYFSRCYWSGKVFVHYILSDVVFRTSPSSWRGTQLEAELAQAVIDFPYADCVEQLDALRPIDVPSHGSSPYRGGHWAFMAKLGALLDREPETRAKLVHLIQSRGGTVHVNLGPSQTSPPSPPESESSLEAGEGNRMAMYTMKLNEWCMQRGKNMSYDDEQLSVDPPQWQVNVRIEGAIFTGRAKKKANARQIASKQACKELGIKV